MVGWVSDARNGILVGVVISGVAALAGQLATLALHCLGFTSNGPAAGSLAAAWMSSVAKANGGRVPQHSLFAFVESVAMRRQALLGPSTLIGVGVFGTVLYIAARTLRGFMNSSNQRIRLSKPENDIERRLLPSNSLQNKDTMIDAARSNHPPYVVQIPDDESAVESSGNSSESCDEGHEDDVSHHK